MRAVCELLAEVVGTRIAALESFAQGQGELSVRRLEQRMIERISREGDWRGALFDGSRSLLTPLNASGAALLFEDQALVTGDAPGTADIRRISKWLEGKRFDRIFASSSLSADEHEFASLAGVASGLVAARISGEPGEILLWFRKERVRTVTWGGNPFKAPSSGDDPSELSPRRSFAQWHQIVEKTSDPWTLADLAAARMISASVTDVVVQFRSVRILIAQDQLDQVLRQVRSSDQQIIIADAEGQIIESNEAFRALVGAHSGALEHLDELAAYFVDPEEVARKLRDLRGNKQPWRGEVRLYHPASGNRPLLVRADPVLSMPDRVLGFVLLFTDLTDRKAAESARRQFQEGILQSHRRLAGRMNSEADLKFQTLMSGVVENAQLAALEITDGVDLSAMPAMLESLRRSVSRTGEVMEQLAFAPEDLAAKLPDATSHDRGEGRVAKRAGMRSSRRGAKVDRKH
jgi:PAS domain S-box-containing protein